MPHLRPTSVGGPPRQAQGSPVIHMHSNPLVSKSSLLAPASLVLLHQAQPVSSPNCYPVTHLAILCAYLLQSTRTNNSQEAQNFNHPHKTRAYTPILHHLSPNGSRLTNPRRASTSNHSHLDSFPAAQAPTRYPLIKPREPI